MNEDLSLTSLSCPYSPKLNIYAENWAKLSLLYLGWVIKGDDMKTGRSAGSDY